MQTIRIREMMPSEIGILRGFLYEAIHQVEGDIPLPRAIIDQPELAAYIQDFGKADDACLVAEMAGEVIGAVWARIIKGEIKGYGYVDDMTPELSISLYRAYRKQGIGTQLMSEMMDLLRKRGFKSVSLSVQKHNDALRLYERLGFVVHEDLGSEYIMLYRFM